MPYAMRFYQDQLVPGGEGELPAAQRFIFVRYGAVIANGKKIQADEYAYFSETLTLSAAPDTEWSQIWRWEIAQPNADPLLLAGTDTLSSLRLSRVITILDMQPDGEWLFRLDTLTSAPGRVTPRHQHHGPGIRCLYQGTFNVQDGTDLMENKQPGDCWWESGSATVVAWHSRQMAARFVRALVLPVDLEGVISNIWLSDGPPPKVDWRIFIDQKITV
jgi:hypothetical protein